MQADDINATPLISFAAISEGECGTNETKKFIFIFHEIVNEIQNIITLLKY